MGARFQFRAARGSRGAGAAACFRETTTIGLRYHPVEGAVLARAARTVEPDGLSVRVTTVARPGGRTARAQAAAIGRAWWRARVVR
ncbi:nickel insertion protein, partial [Methylobacterium radiotolerans]|uniref:nickel insertion protein n=1 Tax=Methylobacterium radiotolerans TaxID=31998 RepID=UPI001FD95A89